MNLSPTRTSCSAVSLVPMAENEGVGEVKSWCKGSFPVSRGVSKDFFLVHSQSKVLQIAWSEGREDLFPGTGISAPSLQR